MKRTGEEIIGQQFGRLKVLALAGVNKRGTLVFCECACGSKIIRHIGVLRAGKSRSCGCLRQERDIAGGPNLRHGATRNRDDSPEYRAWMSMRKRCNNIKATDFKYYGGRGIKVCERWNSFENFLADMGLKPSAQHSLDRFPDVDGNYEPSNTRWATKQEQQWNRRNTIWIERDGVKKPIRTWEKELGFAQNVLLHRYRSGWPMERLFIPAQTKYRHISK